MACISHMMHISLFWMLSSILCLKMKRQHRALWLDTNVNVVHHYNQKSVESSKTCKQTHFETTYFTMHHVNVCFIHDSSMNHTKTVLPVLDISMLIKSKYHCKSHKIIWLLVHYESECNMRLCWSDGNLYHSENKLWQTPIHWLTNWSQMLIEHSKINWPKGDFQGYLLMACQQSFNSF